MAYEELGDEGTGYFLKLTRLAKKEGVSVKHVINLLQLADEYNYTGLSSFEKGRKWRIDKIHELDLQIERSKELLNNVDDQTASFKQLLNSYHILCERKRQESENLNNEISRLESLVSRFESNNEEYLKIKRAIEEEVRVVLIDGKVLLQFALASVFEVLRTNPDKYDDLLVFDISSPTIVTKQSLQLHIEGYKKFILNEANKLYERLLKYFINSIIDSAAGACSSSNSS